MKKKDKIIIIFILSITAIITIIFIFNIVQNIRDVMGRKENIAYIGNILDNSNYKVHIIKNDFIESDILYEDYSYITALIEFINIDFSYEYNFDRDVNLNYNYIIYANILSHYKDEDNIVKNPLFKKESILINKTENKISNKQIKINEEVNISLDYYNELMNNLMKTYNIALNNVLEIKMLINFNGTIYDKEINNNHEITLSIPLSVKAFDITTNKSFKETEKVFLTKLPSSEKMYSKVIIYIVINIVIIFVSYNIIRKMIDKYTSKYTLSKNKILKEYSDRIVEVANFIKYENWETVDVTSFEELVNLSDEAFEPILFWERRHNQNKGSWFCILRDRVLYRFVLYKSNQNTE